MEIPFVEATIKRPYNNLNESNKKQFLSELDKVDLKIGDTIDL